MWASSSERKIDQADFTAWKFFLLFNLMEGVTPNPETQIANT